MRIIVAEYAFSRSKQDLVLIISDKTQAERRHVATRPRPSADGNAEI